MPALFFYTTAHTIYLLACAFPPNYSTTPRGKKRWGKRFKRKLSTVAKKVGMRRKSRQEKTNHLIKEETPRDPTNPAVCVPIPERKLGEIIMDGSFRASDLVRYVSQLVYILTTLGVIYG